LEQRLDVSIYNSLKYNAEEMYNIRTEMHYKDLFRRYNNGGKRN